MSKKNFYCRNTRKNPVNIKKKKLNDNINNSAFLNSRRNHSVKDIKIELNQLNNLKSNNSELNMITDNLQKFNPFISQDIIADIKKNINSNSTIFNEIEKK